MTACRSLCAAVVSLVSVTPLLADGLPEILQSPTGDAKAVVVESRRARVEDASGGRQTLTLPEGGRVTAFVSTDGGWVAAGTRPKSGHEDLFLLLSAGGTASRLPLPVGGREASRRTPALLADGDGLQGLAWLQGDDPGALEVRASDWTGVGFGPAELVAPRGEGSQLALTSAVLDDGTWLLAWSSFDGSDDEILWAVREGATWRGPMRVDTDNAVPDIVPRLVPTAGGALLAWSRYDGNDYRVVVSRYLGDGWSEPRALGSPGSVFTSWTRSEQGANLLYRSAQGPAWEVLELDATGRPQRRAVLATATRERPMVLSAPRGPRLRWRDASDEAALTWEVVP